MRRLAIFVEGQTEAIFLEKLVTEIAGENQVRIERQEARGGGEGIRTLELVAREEDIGQKYYVLIKDCGADNRVKSDIRDQYDSLVREGYDAIIGIRDVFPDVAYEEVPKLRRNLAFGLKTEPVEVVIALAIMEIEAWFISEHTHFARVSRKLTLQRIKEAVGFDPSQGNVELRPHPAEDLHAIYGLAGLGYTKGKANVERTVDALDYARLYLKLGKEIPDLQCVLDCIDGFLSLGN